VMMLVPLPMGTPFFISFDMSSSQQSLTIS
jgi:hypothetical protein